MLRIYNSLSRKLEEFKPVYPDSLNVGMYTCGPTVYDFAHIGNFRTYTTSDLLLRTLQYNGYEVDYVMNITDVGHLTGDNQGDADTGEDRMEKTARREGKAAWEIAAFYTDAFLKDYKALNLTPPTNLVKATDHIKEQIDLIKTLEEKGFTYTTSDGVYFDTSKFKEYGKLSNLDEIKEGARIEVNPEKHNPRDFALWKFSYPHGKTFEEHQRQIASSPDGHRDPRNDNEQESSKRQMEWESPWGIGFPGWHIECSAMAMKYLGSSFDIHVGGIDLRETHHPNEIAQSEAATGKPFVKYWVHGAFILVQGERMSKSKGNNYKLYDLEKEGYDPLAMRYLYMQAHYRQEMNFTFPALEAAQISLNKLREFVIRAEEAGETHKIGCAEFEQRFLDALNDDLNLPQALAVAWELVRSDYPNSAKLKSLLKFDKVLGLDLEHAQIIHDREELVDIPQDIQDMVRERENLRRNGDFKAADQFREKIKKLGYTLIDSEKGTQVKKIRS
ncbi:MAG: cysteine--tRNA ligase [Candidatus Levybacteria bacterium]|nr:cysteine--tRNA ligase [Candidatus Levybacteria bacterium]